MSRASFFIIFLILFFSISQSQDSLYYKPYQPDSLLKAMEEQLEEKLETQKKIKDSVITLQDSIADLDKKLVLSVVPSEITPPESPEAFQTPFHFPPVPQHYTGTCWSFSATSFFESEIYRIHKKKIKISEIFTAYYEYIEKSKRFIQRYGDSYIAEGSEAEALLDIWTKYGIVPEEAYNGIINKEGLHDHRLLIDELTSFLDYCKENDLWDWCYAEKQIKLILDKHIGTPPQEFTYEGKKYNPQSFLKEVVQLKMEDYVPVISTLKYPFHQKVLLDVPDNWRRSTEYYNLPLQEFYEVIVKGIQNGYTLSIGGDVSEPGYDGYTDIAYVCQWDIPRDYINQESREYRIDNETTTDDHGIHLCGFVNINGEDWFLIKDSSRSARKGKFKGYLFYRGDYVQLKMLSYLIHKDCLKGMIQ